MELTRLKVEHVQLSQSHAQTEQKLASLMSGFNSQLAGEKNKVSQISYQQLMGKQLVDSLRYELSSQGRMIQVLNQADRVNRDRISRLEQNEKKLEIQAQKVQARQQLLSAREQELNRQLSDMGQRENRYLKLEEKEKELKMREQRLKHQTSSRGEVSKYGTARGQ
jgi:hypothetical protein